MLHIWSIRINSSTVAQPQLTTHLLPCCSFKVSDCFHEIDPCVRLQSFQVLISKKISNYVVFQNWIKPEENIKLFNIQITLAFIDLHTTTLSFSAQTVFIHTFHRLECEKLNYDAKRKCDSERKILRKQDECIIFLLWTHNKCYAKTSACEAKAMIIQHLQEKANNKKRDKKKQSVWCWPLIIHLCFTC